MHHLIIITHPHTPTHVRYFPSFIYFLPYYFSHHLFHPLVSSPIFHPVTSEMDWKTTSGFSSTISVPSCPSLPEPPALPHALSLRPSQQSTTQQALPSPYDFTLPAFARAHPPALPKIFQPNTGSGIHHHTYLISMVCCLFSQISFERVSIFSKICHTSDCLCVC